jgi:DNA-binding transcriptional MerR regulator
LAFYPRNRAFPTIRYYEKIGLLRLPKRARRENDYKEYSPAILSRLRAIKELKKIGYTLAEIQQVIASYETGGLDCIVGKGQVLENVRLIEQQISQLLSIKQQLLEAVADCPDHCKINAILERHFGYSALNAFICVHFDLI